MLTLPPARPPSAVDDRPYSHSPQFIWNLWVALWNPIDLYEGQTIELPNDVEDAALGRLHFTAAITGLGWVPCQAAPSGWCQRLQAKFRPDAASVLALFDAVVDEKKRRPGEVFEPRTVEYDLEILSEPETMLPHRLDVAFHVEVLTGPTRTTSLVRFERKTTMQFWHMQRVPAPPPSGPQREPPAKGPLPTEQVQRPKANRGRGERDERLDSRRDVADRRPSPSVRLGAVADQQHPSPGQLAAHRRHAVRQPVRRS
jgi:hypothetical protein